MPSYTIERFRPSLLSGLAELRQSLFGKTLRANIAYFEWMYLTNPYIDEPPLHVALHEGVPVGMRGTLGTRWTCRRFVREHTLPSFTDTGIDPAHRDRGLYAELTGHALAELTARGYSHVLNMTPSPPNFLASTLATGGFRSVGEHDKLVRPGSTSRARIENVARRASGRLPQSALVLAAQERWVGYRLRLEAGAVRRAQPPTGISITVDSHPRPDAMAELAARLSQDERIRHVRDSRYIAWRYANPLARHLFVYAERKGGLAGYAVLQSATSGGPVDIADLEAIDDVARTALLGAVTAGRFTSLSIWASTLAPDVISALAERGFRRPASRRRYSERIILRPLADGDTDDRWSIEGVDLRRLENWDFRAVTAMTY